MYIFQTENFIGTTISASNIFTINSSGMCARHAYGFYVVFFSLSIINKHH